MSRSIPFAIYALLLSFFSHLVGADPPSLSAVYPPALKEGTGTLQFQHNRKVTFQWSSTFDLTTVELWQGPGTSGYFGVQTLVTNATNGSDPEVQWYARNLPGRNSTESMHLHIYNAENQNCGGCHSNSSFFSVVGAGAGTSGQGQKHQKALKLGLGLGLGFGIPLLLVLAGLAILLFLRRRKSRTNAGSAVSPSGTGEQLMDWKEPPEQKETQATDYYGQSPPKHLEMSGTPVLEMHGDAMRSEAPDAPVGAERQELEGDLGVQRP